MIVRFLLAAALFCTSFGSAAGVRLDDSASPRARVNVMPRWLHSGEGLGPEQMNAMVATITNLEFRLDTSRYLGKRVRIYLVVPDFVAGLKAPSGMRLEWTSRRQFLPGSAMAGQRALVYDGVIQQPQMHESLDLTVHLDARLVESGLRFDPAFELDVLP